MRPIASLLALTLSLFGCAHTQQPERKVYVISEGTGGNGSNEGPGVGGAGADAYCGELQNKCFNQCWKRTPKNSTARKGSAEHYQYCDRLSLQEFMKCVKEQEALEAQERQGQKKELRFANIDGALGWLRNHKAEVAMGTVVVVAGVAFVVATGGSGALILAPLGM